jgi:hypothetical protein
MTWGHGLHNAERAAEAGPAHAIHSVFIEDVMTAAHVVQLVNWGAKLLARTSLARASRSITIERVAETPQQEASRVLQSLTNGQLEKLSGNLALAQEVLRPAEIEAAVIPAVARMHFGNALERLVAKQIELDPVLKLLFRHTGKGGGPDFVGIGRFEGLIFDITTPGQAARHIARPYGKDLIIIKYSRPPSFP